MPKNKGGIESAIQSFELLSHVWQVHSVGDPVVMVTSQLVKLTQPHIGHGVLYTPAVVILLSSRTDNHNIRTKLTVSS